MINNLNVTIKIPNHHTSTLSDLDMLIVNSVPPGGNWKNIPLDVPSRRIQQIRDSFSKGEGSRSTYYGRLLPNKPSYTINTYFNRPGNGCHIHYKQDRVLSQREAARLQSFPDKFLFLGSQGSINNQIGNAVPPLLAFQIALQINEAIGQCGVFIDLFSGAGGMGLGFKWAGWQPILANDIDAKFLETYSQNVHENTLVGSITDPNIFSELVDRTLEAKRKYHNRPFWVLGGPPCQGFSTAGNKRTMDDERNSLFLNYTEFLKIVKPDGFVFENVAGLLSMEKGSIFNQVKVGFEGIMPHVKGFVFSSEKYAIPQRRKRVFLIGQRKTQSNILPPPILTSLGESKDLFNNYFECVSVEDALSDLPELNAGQNGSILNYQHSPITIYQKLMRGVISPFEYLDNFKFKLSV
ncbi:DNA (cytosine-5-)-methyltransferase [Arcicella sp. LKC2W]|uniref:DNA (cytosine-5-)-methyltransferase n=1 Tax=Arcicella sp. LKC2W TaxID=2984198 RepID=UPI002B20A24E|nr:DNA (cytosine-5-)-methyltransferase [Arcicella sp. LKC2W]MEA5461679.1 DNA (cytosine-5-)-methyltransferase [Arcicella sp. LKC2W]